MFQRCVLSLCLIVAIVFYPNVSLRAQDAAKEDAAATKESQVVTFTTEQDHQNMMKQLGITKLRPGPSGNPSDPNAANTDESKANPYPELPRTHDHERRHEGHDVRAMVESAASARDRRRL